MTGLEGVQSIPSSHSSVHTQPPEKRTKVFLLSIIYTWETLVLSICGDGLFWPCYVRRRSLLPQYLSEQHALPGFSHGRLTAKFRLSSTPCFGLNNQSSSSSMTYDFGCYMAAIILGRPIGTVAIGEIRARILSTNAGCIAVTGGALFWVLRELHDSLHLYPAHIGRLSLSLDRVSGFRPHLHLFPPFTPDFSWSSNTGLGNERVPLQTRPPRSIVILNLFSLFVASAESPRASFHFNFFLLSSFPFSCPSAICISSRPRHIEPKCVFMAIPTNTSFA